MAITRAQQFRQMLKKGGEPVVQGGVENYLGDQPQVVVPRKWQSGPDKPPTELAYITEAEKKLLLKEDIHGSLKDGPNEGPAGVMSLDSFGDIGGAGAGGADTEAGGGAKEGAGFSGRGAGEFETDRKSQKAFEDRIKNQKAALQIAERKQAKDLSELLGRDIKERKNIADYGSADSLQRLFMRGVGDSNIPGFLGMGLNAITGLRNIGLRKNIDFFRNDPRTAKARAKYGVSAEGYKEYMADRLAGKIDAAGNEFIGGREEDESFQEESEIERRLRLLEEQQALATSSTTPVMASAFGGLSPRITGSLFDFRGMAADGGRIGAMGGGVMDLESARQMMFLGGIAKSISKGLKGVTRAAKKVFKSPVGKAALLGLGAYYMPGIGIKATGGFSQFAKPGGFLSTLLTKGGDKALNLDNLSGLKIAGLLTAAPFLFSSDEEEEDKPTDMGPTLTMEELLAIRGNPFGTITPRIEGSLFAAEGGRIGYQKGSKEPVAKKVMPLLDMGGKEMDLRDNGGFVPIGRMEKADDVPARLSKNEFVFTADAVRNAGDGDVDKGAEVMYNMMKNLEAGGSVSEESQGLDGAREMFQTSQRLGEVI